MIKVLCGVFVLLSAADCHESHQFNYDIDVDFLGRLGWFLPRAFALRSFF